MLIFDGNLTEGFTIGDTPLHARRVREYATEADETWGTNPQGEGWEVVRTNEVRIGLVNGPTERAGHRVAWFEHVGEALRYIKAVDDGYRCAKASAEIIRHTLNNRKEQA